MTKIRIEKKSEKYLIIISDDEKTLTGIYLSPSDLRKLSANINDVLDYDRSESGDDI
jgi:hypothetical protein